jgi:hypothetical protein
MEITNYDKALNYVREQKLVYTGWECTYKLYKRCDKLEDLLMSLDTLEWQEDFNKLCIDNYVENCIDEIQETVEELLYY